MIRIIKKCGADFFVWYKPHNSFDSPFGIIDDFPKVVIFDVEKMDFETVDYDLDKMISSEI